jgi:ribonuclease PH
MPAHNGIRNDGRSALQMRPVVLLYNQFGYADGSVLFSIGNTKVLANVSLQDGVPHFLRNSGKGWLTAEYAMLPSATHTRTLREFDAARRNGRSVEISRLIGRCFRSVCDTSALGEKTIIIDCDVLQADGGTRAACITAASYALQQAIAVWKKQGRVAQSFNVLKVAALSAGMVEGQLSIDLAYEEDCRADADATFVVREDAAIIEMVVSGERAALSWNEITTLHEAALAQMQSLFSLE